MSEEPKSKSQYRRISAQGVPALEMALSEIKALKAENEALKKDAEKCEAQYLRDGMALHAKLSLYTSWQPSDPGTKEAMEIAAKNEADRNKMGWKPEGWERALGSLATALTAAMVRLEEAEKKIAAMENRFKGLI